MIIFWFIPTHADTFEGIFHADVPRSINSFIGFFVHSETLKTPVWLQSFQFFTGCKSIYSRQTIKNPFGIFFLSRHFFSVPFFFFALSQVCFQNLLKHRNGSRHPLRLQSPPERWTGAHDFYYRAGRQADSVVFGFQKYSLPFFFCPVFFFALSQVCFQTRISMRPFETLSQDWCDFVTDYYVCHWWLYRLWVYDYILIHPNQRMRIQSGACTVTLSSCVVQRVSFTGIDNNVYL